MDIFVEQVSREEFLKISKDVHLGAFFEHREPDFERLNYALVCHDSHDKLTAYATIIEHDADSAYMQHGGCFSDVEKFKTVKSYLLMMNYLKGKYKTITTRIFNENIAMLKLAFTAGLRVIGVEYSAGSDSPSILLHLRLDVVAT